MDRYRDRQGRMKGNWLIEHVRQKLTVTLLMTLQIFLVVQGVAQGDVMDSLKNELRNAKHDTSRCAILYAMIEAENDDELWPLYNEQLYTLAETNLRSLSPNQKILDDKYSWYKAEALVNRGVMSKERGDHEKALDDYNQSLVIYKRLNNKQGLATVYNNLGMIYRNNGHTAEALDYYNQCLTILKEIGDKKRAAYSMSNLAGIYRSVGDLPKAISFYEQSIRTLESLKDLNGIAITHNNMGGLYLNQGDVGKAIREYRMSLSIMQKLGDSLGVAQCLNNIGHVHHMKDETDSALKCYTTSLRIRQRLGLKPGIAESFLSIARIYIELGEDKQATASLLSALSLFEKVEDVASTSTVLCHLSELSLKDDKTKQALSYAERAKSLSMEIGYPEYIRFAAKVLYEAYKKSGDRRKALQNYELYITMRDSVVNAETKKATVRSQLKYDYEKRAAADSVRNAEVQKIKDAQLLAREVKLKHDRMQFWFLVCGLSFVAAGLVFVINRFRITKKQKKVIELQKEQVDHAYERLAEKNKEVLDSIYYARRIQRALITNETYFTRTLNRLTRKNNHTGR